MKKILLIPTPSIHSSNPNKDTSTLQIEVDDVISVEQSSVTNAKVYTKSSGVINLTHSYDASNVYNGISVADDISNALLKFSGSTGTVVLHNKDYSPFDRIEITNVSYE